MAAARSSSVLGRKFIVVLDERAGRMRHGGDATTRRIKLLERIFFKYIERAGEMRHGGDGDAMLTVRDKEINFELLNRRHDGNPPATVNLDLPANIDPCRNNFFSTPSAVSQQCFDLDWPKQSCKWRQGAPHQCPFNLDS